MTGIVGQLAWEGGLDLSIFHRPPDFRLRALDRDHVGRGDLRLSVAAGAVSDDFAADGFGHVQLSRRQRHGCRHFGGRADRAAGQRRRRHALHVVELHQRRLVQPDGHVQARHRSEHGPGAGAKPGEPGRCRRCPT